LAEAIRSRDSASASESGVVADWIELERDGVRLACLDYGGEGPPVLILPGLAGHAREWAHTAGWLTERARVLVLDARGQGHSERHPEDVSPEAQLADAAFAVERIGISPVVVIGHSIGGQRAIMLAGERPDLVRALVVVDSGPGADDDAEAIVEAVRDDLASWPAPFESKQAAVEFFGGPSLKAEAWADGLEERDDGWWPRWEVDLMERSLHEAFVGREYWEQWEAIRCPTLVVLTLVPEEEGKEMGERLPQAQVVSLGHSSHDLHLYRPEEWRRALMMFLDGVLDEVD
jgi:pimeloyl-ACP methyl ester carboxylesterase